MTPTPNPVSVCEGPRRGSSHRGSIRGEDGRPVAMGGYGRPATPKNRVNTAIQAKISTNTMISIAVRVIT